MVTDCFSWLVVSDLDSSDGCGGQMVNGFG
jgi:hypothetical protein